jgi:16S rRNA (guanine1207-N2)-methyltransferase
MDRSALPRQTLAHMLLTPVRLLWCVFFMPDIPDIQYGADPLRPARLVVDYDASRLGALTGVAQRCCELIDLVAEGGEPLDGIAMTVFPYTSKRQLTRDFFAAARLLARTGTLTVRLIEPRLASSVGRQLASHFTQVRLSDKGTLTCQEPRPDEGAGSLDDTETFSYLDPTTQRELRLMTRSGLFSIGTLDLGTMLLLDVLSEEHDFQARPALLDIGCGYGAVGCVAALRGARATMIDSDCRAVKLARANLAANDLAAEVMVGDASKSLPPGPFDLVVSNPPTHAGSARLRRLFDLAAASGTRVLIVVRAHLNYEKWLKDNYRVQRLAERDGYKVVAFSHHP